MAMPSQASASAGIRKPQRAHTHLRQRGSMTQTHETEEVATVAAIDKGRTNKESLLNPLVASTTANADKLHVGPPPNHQHSDNDDDCDLGVCVLGAPDDGGDHLRYASDNNNNNKFDGDDNRGCFKAAAHAHARRLHWLAAGRIVLYSYDEAPHYQRDNAHIRGGYRAHLSHNEAWISLFHAHNECANVWSHLVPGVVSIATLAALIAADSGVPDAAGIADRAIIALFLICAAYTFISSALFHLHLSVSKEAFVFYGCLDYSGISAGICGGGTSVSYYILYCDPLARIIWLTALVFFNLVGIVGPVFKFWNGPAFRTSRTIIYLTSGALSFGPIIHFISKYGVEQLPDPSTNIAMPALGIMALFYFVGAVIYAARLPERFSPGSFDYIGHSHMIWHIFVVIATTTLYIAVRALMDWRLDPAHSCSMVST